MKLTRIQKTIIWGVVILIIIIMGLKTKEAPYQSFLVNGKYIGGNASSLFLYELILINREGVSTIPTNDEPPSFETIWRGPLKPFHFLLKLKLGDYKIHLIVATLLIGLALFITVGSKREKD